MAASFSRRLAPFIATVSSGAPPISTRTCAVRLERGCAVSAADYFDMMRARTRLVRAMDQWLAALDVLVMPTTPIVAPTMAEVTGGESYAARNTLVLRNTSVGNFFDLCGISLPLKAKASGRPDADGAQRPRPHAAPDRRRGGESICSLNGRDESEDHTSRRFRACDRANKSGIMRPSADRKSHGRIAMSRKFQSNSPRATRRTFSAGFSAALGAGLVAGVAPFNIVRAQGGPLKVGVLLPRSGFEAGIGEDCQRGVDIAPAIFKSMGLPDLTIINGDTESNVDTARARAEKLIGEGAQALVGSFDSGQIAAIAQVAEQKGIPLRHQYRRRAARSPSRATSSCFGIFRPRR